MEYFQKNPLTEFHHLYKAPAANLRVPSVKPAPTNLQSLQPAPAQVALDG